MLGTSSALRSLGPADLDEVVALVDLDPLVDVFVGSRVHASRLRTGRLAGELWGYQDAGRLTSVCFSGANLVPVRASPAAVHGFAELATHRGRRCSSMVGPAEALLSLWDLLRPEWGPARVVRARQPVMATAVPPLVPADPHVRPVRLEELELLLPAAVAMFTEEVGVSPLGSDGGAYYRARLAELIRAGRALARFEDGEIIFKAEIGAVSPHACQIQGVWVRPDRRGEGLSVGGMAAVVEYALRHVAPAVSLYVNDFNLAARRSYRRVGFREIATFATVMF